MGNGIFIKAVGSDRAKLERAAAIRAEIEGILVIMVQGPHFECQADLSQVVLTIGKLRRRMELCFGNGRQKEAGNDHRIRVG